MPFNKDFRNIGLTNCSVVDNGAVMDNDSVVGTCVKFNPDVSSGGTKYITLANKTYELMEDDSSFSVAAFIKITGSFYSNGAGVFGAIQYRTSGVGICITSARKIHLQVAYGDGESEFNSTTSIPTNEWHHICVTYKKETKKAHFYLDGVLDGKCTLASPWINNRSYNILIGKGSQGGWGYTFPGLMKDFRVYNHELKDWEIKKLASKQMYELESNLHLKPSKNLFAGKTVSQQGGTWTLLGETFNGFPVYNNLITDGSKYNDGGFSLKTPIDYDGVGTHVTVSFYIRLHVPWNNNIHGYLQVLRTDNTTTNYNWNFPNGVTNSNEYLNVWRRVSSTDRKSVV